MSLQEQNGPKTTCVLQDVTPGTYAIEVRVLIISYKMSFIQTKCNKFTFLFPQLRDDNNTTRKQTQYHVSQGKKALILKKDEAAGLCEHVADVDCVCCSSFPVGRTDPRHGHHRSAGHHVRLRHPLHRHVSQETARYVSVISESPVSSQTCFCAVSVNRSV